MDISAIPAAQIFLRNTMRGVIVKQTKSKKCARCGTTKPVTQFPKCLRNPDGLRYHCRLCANKIDREYYARSQKRRFSQFAFYIKRRHGVTSEQYGEVLKLQKGVCAICGKLNPNKNRRLALDHCHTNGQFRGLLCGKCNIGIGQFNDNANLLRKAALYIEKSLILL